MSQTGKQAWLEQSITSAISKVSGGDWRQEEKGTTEDEMAGWHH